MALTLPSSGVFDTGALIAVTDVAMGRSASPLARALLAHMEREKEPMRAFAPAVVIAEWWRGEDGPATRVRDAVTGLDTPKALGIDAGLLLAAMPDRPKSTKELLVVDAVVVVAASRIGAPVFTSDPGDLVPLRDKLVELGKIAKDVVRIYPM